MTRSAVLVLLLPSLALALQLSGACYVPGIDFKGRKSTAFDGRECVKHDNASGFCETGTDGNKKPPVCSSVKNGLTGKKAKDCTEAKYEGKFKAGCFEDVDCGLKECKMAGAVPEPWSRKDKWQTHKSDGDDIVVAHGKKVAGKKQVSSSKGVITGTEWADDSSEQHTAPCQSEGILDPLFEQIAENVRCKGDPLLERTRAKETREEGLTGNKLSDATRVKDGVFNQDNFKTLFYCSDAMADQTYRIQNIVADNEDVSAEGDCLKLCLKVPGAKFAMHTTGGGWGLDLSTNINKANAKCRCYRDCKNPSEEGDDGVLALRKTGQDEKKYKKMTRKEVQTVSGEVCNRAKTNWKIFIRRDP